MSDTAALRALRTLPSVGPAFAADLLSLGYRAPADLVGQDPVEMFVRLESQAGRQDPCVLDSLRCAVYAAGASDPDLERLKWWTWSRLRLAGQVGSVAEARAAQRQSSEVSHTQRSPP